MRKAPPTTKTNVINPRVTVRAFEVMSDASGAPAVLEYDGFAYVFDMLGGMTRRLIGGAGSRRASKVAIEVCTHAYVTLLEQRVDLAWREANVAMYDDAAPRNPAAEGERAARAEGVTFVDGASARAGS